MRIPIIDRLIILAFLSYRFYFTTFLVCIYNGINSYALYISKLFIFQILLHNFIIVLLCIFSSLFFTVTCSVRATLTYKSEQSNKNRKLPFLCQTLLVFFLFVFLYYCSTRARGYFCPIHIASSLLFI